MKHARVLVLLALAILVAHLSVACIGSYTDPGSLGGDSADAWVAPAKGSAWVDSGATMCTPRSSLPPGQDPSSLPSCCTMGAAHCVPSADVPASFASQLSMCTGGSCVPDSFIMDPTLVPKTCASLNMAAGVCLSVCVPEVGNYASLLPQDVCAADERCAPCISPLNHMSTGACDIGKSILCSDTDASTPPGAPVDAAPMCPYMGPPIIDPTTLPSCDPNGGAHCLAANLVPTALQSQLAMCATGLCVPDVFIASGGNYVPPTCSSVGGAEGRCLDEMIPQVASQISQLPQATCQTYERCVPCYSPLDGTTTGACTQSCDPGPTQPPYVFGTCCTENGAPQGRCIPSASIPSSEQADVASDDCQQSGTSCVPSEMLPTSFLPPRCSGSAFFGDYSGVCLSDCLSFGFFDSLGIAQGSCDDIHECVPCSNPVTGQPTGAPGC